MFLKLKNTTFQSITGKIYDFVTPLIQIQNWKYILYIFESDFGWRMQLTIIKG